VNTLQPTPAKPRLRLWVTKAAETIIRQGHPWLFADSVLEQNRFGELGDLGVVYDRNDRFLAVGLIDPDSPICLRVLHAGKPQQINDAWWHAHFERALERRTGLFDAATNGYRLINGESDGWPGLVLDRYANTLVVKVYTAAWFVHWDTVMALLERHFVGFCIVLRLSRNIQTQVAERFALHDGDVLTGQSPDGPVVFLESGLRFEADVLKGQKTGFFLDQRENRRWLETLSGHARVLNAFSYTGGFSLYAARGGAQHVTSLDISAHALEGAKRNFALNQDVPSIAACDHQTVQADVFEWLCQQQQRFDVIVLDPPSLAKREIERARAIGAYRGLAVDAIPLLEPGGVLLACSCSAHVTSDAFFQAVRDAASHSGRPWQELRIAHHAPDHHASFAEAQYLKAIALRFEP
jgi:23S rRNA (cytosine1962-C5)-methyltransferase